VGVLEFIVLEVPSPQFTKIVPEDVVTVKPTNRDDCRELSYMPIKNCLL